MNSFERGEVIAPKAPEIYKLALEGSSLQVVQKMYELMNQPVPNPEATYLGFQILLERGEDELLRQIAKGSDQLAQAAALLGEGTDKSSFAGGLEKALGIKRSGLVIEPEKGLGSTTLIEVLYEHAREKGYTDKSLRECHEDYMRQLAQSNHLGDEIDSQFLASDATFGTTELAYIELLGPLEVVRLRASKSPHALLLGSLGKYSEREFVSSMRKINPGILTQVIDRFGGSVAAIRQAGLDENRLLVQGDARRTPYKDGSFDHIFSNHLFHYLGFDEKQKPSHEYMEASVEDIFSEAFRTLKPGGSFTIVEQPYGSYKASPSMLSAYKERVRRIAMWAGFELANELESCPIFPLIREKGSAKVDENGFAHTEQSAVVRMSQSMTARFRKPEEAM